MAHSMEQVRRLHGVIGERKRELNREKAKKMALVKNLEQLKQVQERKEGKKIEIQAKRQELKDRQTH